MPETKPCQTLLSEIHIPPSIQTYWTSTVILLPDLRPMKLQTMPRRILFVQQPLRPETILFQRLKELPIFQFLKHLPSKFCLQKCSDSLFPNCVNNRCYCEIRCLIKMGDVHLNIVASGTRNDGKRQQIFSKIGSKILRARLRRTCSYCLLDAILKNFLYFPAANRRVLWLILLRLKNIIQYRESI